MHRPNSEPGIKVAQLEPPKGPLVAQESKVLFHVRDTELVLLV